MSIKGFLLGSAAALVAVTRAGAADAVIVAEPEPVEHVRVCDVYGTGYFYVPGTETCLRIGGYVRYQFAGGDLWARTAIDHEDGSNNDAWNQYARLSLRTWTGTETELGTLRTFTETRLQWGNGSPSMGNDSAPVTGGSNGFDGTATTLNFAWIELGGFRVGKDESVFTTFFGGVGDVIADALVPFGNFDTTQISYTFTAGSFAGIVSLEAGADGVNGHDYSIDSYVPHMVAGGKFTQDWGGVGLVASYDSIHETFAVKARVDIKVDDKFTAFLMAGWGEDDDYNLYKPWGGEWAVWAAMTAAVSEKAKVNMQLSYDDSEQFGAALNVAYELVPGLRVMPEIDYYNAGKGGDDAWGGILRFQRNF